MQCNSTLFEYVSDFAIIGVGRRNRDADLVHR